MQLGIPTLLELGSLDKHVLLSKEIGFDFFEMSFMFPWFQTDNIDLAEFERLGSENGIGYTLHLPEDFNPFSFSPEIRHASLEIAAYAFKMAKALNIKRITMHLCDGTYASMNGVKHYLYDACSNLYMESVNRFGEFCQNNLEGTDIFLCIENTKGFRSFHKKAIESLIQHDNIGFTFDVGHNYKAGSEDQPFMFGFDGKIKHFHIHDVTATGNHYGLGQGILPVDDYLALAQKTGASALIEVKELSSLLFSVAYLKKRHYL